ncbi:MAG: MMPL family transporter [Candidatus Desulfatibia sp.]|uniref:efflux RND transporter permease subunit n=1 Tax=Candidatus Desulfatibia sp. TaxID=3101189 RepID=UPI002F33F5A6
MHQIIYRFHKHILIFSVFLTLAATVLVTRLKLDLDLIALLPADNPSVDAFFDVAETIGIQSTLIALVEMPENIDQKDSDAVIEHLAKKYVQSRLITEIEYKSEARQLANLFKILAEYFPNLVKTGDLTRLTQKFSDEGIHEQVLENKKILMTPFGTAAKELIYIDPLGLRNLLGSSLTVPTGKRTIKTHSGYYRTKGGNYIIFLKPEKPPQNVAFSKKLMAQVYSLGKLALAELPEKMAGFSNKIRISYTGGYPIAVNDEAITKKDIKVTLLTSFLGVMLLLGLSFRTLRILFFVGLPLAASLLWTLGFASLIFQRLNVLTFIFSCVLIGLGIDFAIHIVNRYFGENQVNLPVSQRLQLTFKESGMGIFIGGITTAVAFFSVGISDFKGFSELGILTGIGILICLLGMLFLLPALLVTFSNEKRSPKTVAIAGFGLNTLMGGIRKYPRIVLVAAAIIVVLSIISGTGIHFDDNLKNFRPVDSKVLRLQDKITDWLGGSTAAILLVAEGDTEAEAMETSASIYSSLDELKRSGMIAGIRSISSYFPAPSQQRNNMEFIRQHADIFDIKRIKKTFNEALKENGFEILDLYDEYFESLSRALSEDKLLLPTSLQDKELEKFLKLFVIRKDNAYKTVTYISPNKDLWSRSETFQFKEMIIRTLAEGGIKKNRYLLTGPNLLTGDLKELIINNLQSSLLFASLSIVAVLLIYYRSLKLVLFSITPLLIGLASLAGIMSMFGLDFNFLNLIVIPMIVGIGIDDGVHFTNTFCQSDHLNNSEKMFQTGRAVVLTSLTTIIGFGSIILSHYPGLKSMGYVAIIGISACMIASIVVLPAIFAVVSRSKHG